jgi:hypothetical protein
MPVSTSEPRVVLRLVCGRMVQQLLDSRLREGRMTLGPRGSRGVPEVLGEALTVGRDVRGRLADARLGGRPMRHTRDGHTSSGRARGIARSLRRDLRRSAGSRCVHDEPRLPLRLVFVWRVGLRLVRGRKLDLTVWRMLLGGNGSIGDHKTSMVWRSGCQEVVLNLGAKDRKNESEEETGSALQGARRASGLDVAS